MRVNCREQIANPAEPVNGQDERRKCAAVDSPARLCCSVIKRATAQDAAALCHYSERGIFHDRTRKVSRTYPAYTRCLLQDRYSPRCHRRSPEHTQPLTAKTAPGTMRTRRKREISLEYLIEEKHYPFSTTDKYFAEQSGMTSYPLFVCGQMVLLESPELAAALSALSQMEQEIIFLYYFQRLTHREIGRRYGRAGNTTGRRIQMILRRLRAELEGLSYEPATSL